ncbi:cupin domain-containing protein [Jeotgalibaca sp. MA1X17-3]|uniref:cupin domain-containing protein n=1 Tax=Jeotgalibaca sp. MA1X17-3 TaxID=2908211 RepID=UPI001F176062|nr:cupin domain-containing protein [Jeotgalibaca sp. MA1X17-3]UJF14618.1 cupin domain-containing protein [Jeotgalibaca sp. MA1X17-3]
METAEYWINKLDLQPHPEGGYYKQTDYSKVTYSNNDKILPLYTNIYFLLTPESPSHFHELTSDELWFYHTGAPLTVHSLHKDGSYTQTALGIDNGHSLHHNVLAGTIFGSTVEEGYSLVSCTVIPGFDFDDFTLFTKDDLIKRYPNHQEIINRLAYEQLPE